MLLYIIVKLLPSLQDTLLSSAHLDSQSSSVKVGLQGHPTHYSGSATHAGGKIIIIQGKDIHWKPTQCALN